jgi:hypothetical protein
MRLLELFSGTGSVRKAVGAQFDEIVSIDILDKFIPSECCDILQWNYKKYPSGYFDCIWASPPCTEYSKAKTRGVRNFQLADSIVQRTIEIIDYFQPDKWFIENPESGKLKDRDFMLGIPFYDVDYCCYGKEYRKRTRIWTTIEGFEPKLCDPTTCPMMIDGRHKMSCGNGYTHDTKTDSKYSGRKYTNEVVSKDEKYSIPAKLIQDLFQEVQP